MNAGLPLDEPQFWLVSAAAVAALIYLLRKRLRLRRRGEIELPCANCSQAPGARRPPNWLKRLRGPS